MGEVFEVWVLEAKNLSSKEVTGKVSSFCRLKSNFNQERFKSIVSAKTTIPYWGQCFRFTPTDKPPSGNVVITLIEKSFFSERFLGEILLDIGAVQSGLEYDEWVPLQNEPMKPKDAPRGLIHIRHGLTNIDEVEDINGRISTTSRPRALSTPGAAQAVANGKPPNSPPASDSESDSEKNKKNYGTIRKRGVVSEQVKSPAGTPVTSPRAEEEKPKGGSHVKKSSTEAPSSPPTKKGPAPPSPDAAERDRSDTVSILKIEDKYDIGKQIGKGAFASVYAARNKFTDDDVAIKVVNKTNIKPRELEMLMREIQIIMKLKHPNIVRMLDKFDGPKKLYLVMELVPEGELFEKIVKNGSYSEEDARIIVRQILEGVGYMHRNNVVHRDLKPENILCVDSTTIKLADFGMSKDTAMGAPRTAVGTPSYIAPEIIKGLNKKEYDFAVDIWSVGILCYVLLCGFTPFYAESQKQLFEKIVNADYDFPSPEWDDISAKAKKFVQFLLNVDPATRPTAEEALQHNWMKEASPQIKLGLATKNLALLQSKYVEENGFDDGDDDDDNNPLS